MVPEKNPIPVSLPEAEGIPSQAVLEFLQELARYGHKMHGFILLRHDRIVAEGYWSPIQKEDLHRLYSTSKSFVSVAIGMLQDEGRLSIRDKIAPYFPEKLPANLHPFVADATVRDLLRMATPHAATSYGLIRNPEHDWVRTFFELEPNHRPGQVFSYDTAATTVLAALAEKLSGMPLLEYLRSRGFDEMGFSPEATCVKTPDGKVSWAGSGMLVTPHDLAKFALLCLHYGRYGGRQLVSEAYMREATSKQIENGQWGYGYQFWRHEYGFYCAGMGGQMVYCYPEKDMALVTLADLQGQPGYVPVMEDAFKRTVLPKVSDKPLSTTLTAKAMQETLRKYCANLAVPLVKGETYQPVADRVSGSVYSMEFNPKCPAANLDFEEFGVSFDKDASEGVMYWSRKGRHMQLGFGLGHFVRQDFPGFAHAEDIHEPMLVYGFDNPEAKAHMPCITSAAWSSPTELVICVMAVGYYLGTLDIHISFGNGGESVTVWMQPSAEKFWTEYRGFQSGTEK